MRFIRKMMQYELVFLVNKVALAFIPTICIKCALLMSESHFLHKFNYYFLHKVAFSRYIDFAYSKLQGHLD